MYMRSDAHRRTNKPVSHQSRDGTLVHLDIIGHEVVYIHTTLLISCIQRHHQIKQVSLSFLFHFVVFLSVKALSVSDKY